MRRFVTAFLLAVMMLGLIACGKPSNMSLETFDLGKEAVEVGEKYLAGTMSSSSAEKRLEIIYDDLELKEYKDVGSGDSSVRVSVSGMKLYLMLNNDDEFENSLNNLKSKL